MAGVIKSAAIIRTISLNISGVIHQLEVVLMKNSTVTVTRHAGKRIRQRLGINKRSTEKAAEKALQFGITHAEAKGKLSRHLDGIFLLNYKPTNMRVYNHSVYLFHGVTLITVLPLPQKFWTYADKLQRQKKECNENETPNL